MSETDENRYCVDCGGFGWNLNRAQDGSGDFYRDRCESCKGTGLAPEPIDCRQDDK